jgi:anthranilate synthase component 2
LKDIIRKYGATKVYSGVCLGQQAIGEVYGGPSNLEKVYHGIATMVKTVVDDELFEGLETNLKWTLSPWVVDPLYPKCWKRLPLMKMVSNVLRHRTFDARGTISSRKCVNSEREKDFRIG